ncbi:hypothetical protein DC20_21690 (plasmid) [Rufibacter tibetensis]|uniref:Uncharacterized protein n=1 Tax=Rufibacter tibetensis TaxID=512763 RepID=A0A0P0CPL4_9BACT|nr:hypothetical protein DC20_21690 [Rufibacter tibetensis]
MNSIPYQADRLNFREMLEPIISSATCWMILFFMGIWILIKIIKKDKKRIVSSISMYDPSSLTFLTTIPSKPIAKIDYSITPADPRFQTLPWEYKEALYVNRINQLTKKCRKLQEQLNAARIK